MSRPQSSGSFSVIGSDITITGDIAASTELHIDGTVEGDISCTALVQGETGVVKGTVKAQSARLAGRVMGSLEAGELVILSSATIEGDARYDMLTIEPGATVECRFSLRDSNAEKATSPAEFGSDARQTPVAAAEEERGYSEADDEDDDDKPHLSIAN